MEALQRTTLSPKPLAELENWLERHSLFLKTWDWERIQRDVPDPGGRTLDQWSTFVDCLGAYVDLDTLRLHTFLWLGLASLGAWLKMWYFRVQFRWIAGGLWNRRESLACLKFMPGRRMWVYNLWTWEERVSDVHTEASLWRHPRDFITNIDTFKKVWRRKWSQWNWKGKKAAKNKMPSGEHIDIGDKTCLIILYSISPIVSHLHKISIKLIIDLVALYSYNNPVNPQGQRIQWVYCIDEEIEI